MNIYDLPIPNFGELSDEAALKLILEVRSRRRIVVNQRPVQAKSISERGDKVKVKSFNSPQFGALTREQILELIASLKSSV